MFDTHGNGHCDADEEEKRPKRDVLDARLVAKLVVQAVGDCAAQGKRKGHAGSAHAQRGLPITHEPAQIDLEPDDEQKQDQPDVRDETEIRHGRGGENRLREPRDAAHDRRAEEDAADDFGDDARLTDLGEGPVERAAEDDDYAGLDDEEHERVLGVIVRGVSAFDYAALRGDAVG